MARPIERSSNPNEAGRAVSTLGEMAHPSGATSNFSINYEELFNTLKNWNDLLRVSDDTEDAA